MSRIILRQGLFQLTDEFVYWCCNSLQTLIDDFKNQLNYYDDILDVCKHYRLNNEMIAEVISWFYPSEETVIVFKEKHISGEWF